MYLANRLRDILLAVCLTAVLLSTALVAATSPTLIDHAVALGAIDTNEAKILQAVALVRQDALPPEYRSTETTPPGKCGTDQIREAMNILESNPEQYRTYRDILSRPGTQVTYQSGLGYFWLHYDTTGGHAVPAQDVDENGIPDFIERACEYADSSWRYEVTVLGHLPPPSDGAQGGGSNKYDIYFQNVSVYGYTQAESPGPNPWNDYSSHIVVHNNFAGFPPNQDPDGDVLGALKVTIAHEFYHAIQFAYDIGEDIFFMEQSSTWMEEMVFPAVNDNYNYLPYFYNVPQISLEGTGDHMYAAFVWPKFLEERFGASIMPAIWSACRSNSSFDSWHSAIVARGGNLQTEFTRFLVWNYHTGDRATSSTFKSGADYPQVHVMRYSETVPDSDRTSVEPPQPLASNYIVINNYGGMRGILTFDFTGMISASWGVGYVIDYGSGQYQDSLQTQFTEQNAKIYIPHFENVLRVIFIPGVTSTYGDSHNFSYNLYWRKQADFNNDGTIDISDAVAGIRYIFSGGEPPEPVEAMDANCDGLNDISDVTYLIAFIFGGGPAPCQ
jgi:hypothetical protein